MIDKQYAIDIFYNRYGFKPRTVVPLIFALSEISRYFPIFGASVTKKKVFIGTFDSYVEKNIGYADTLFLRIENEIVLKLMSDSSTDLGGYNNTNNIIFDTYVHGDVGRIKGCFVGYLIEI
jgi:hypothetical protein